MEYKVFGKNPSRKYPFVFLVTKHIYREMVQEYVKNTNIDIDHCAFVELYQEPGKKKTPVKIMQEYYDSVKEDLKTIGAKYLIINDAEYFKRIALVSRAQPFLGYVLHSGDFHVSYIPSTRQIFRDPIQTRKQIKFSIDQILAHSYKTYSEPGSSILEKTSIVRTDKGICNELERTISLNIPLIAVDIETYSLRHTEAGIATISFASDEYGAFSFEVGTNTYRRKLLKTFFESYRGKVIYHNAAYDVTVLIYELYMERNNNDTKGLLNGLKIMTRGLEDTKIIAYLATNSCAGNSLGLKDLAQEYAGNFALDGINDITQIPIDDVLEYNCVDALSTLYVYNKYRPKMIQDNQLDIYENIFLPALTDIIQMQLTGLPINMDTVRIIKKSLQEDRDRALNVLENSPIIKLFEERLARDWVEERNSKLKRKVVSVEDFTGGFNPNSNPQLQKLLYELLELPVLDLTDGGSPATGKDTLDSLMAHTKDKGILEILQALIDYNSVDKILSAFIPAFERAHECDGWNYLHGNFNLGGTVSGRLSSSSPNLQQIPSTGTKYAEPIKQCFEAPPGWLLLGLDFASLEDRISALTTKDPNKLKIYLDGLDGHSYRAFSYWPEKFPYVRQAIEGERCFEMEIDGKLSLLKSGDFVTYKDQQIPVEKFYEEQADKRI